MTRVSVELDPTVFDRLALLASKHDLRVDQYLARLGGRLVKRRVTSTDDALVVLWRTGAPDKVIAAELNMTNAAVADKRRQFGYPANRAKDYQPTNPKES